MGDIPTTLGGQPDRAAHARAAQPAVPAGVLGEVLLVVVLGVVERPGLGDLGRDVAEAGAAELLLVGLLRDDRGVALSLARRVERRPVLGADVVALAHALGRVVVLPEEL